MRNDMERSLARAEGPGPIDDEDALALADLPAHAIGPLCAAAAKRRDALWGRRVTFSPKVFLPLTNLCRNRCDYCSFRRSPGQEGEWTMTPDEVTDTLARARTAGAVEALFCLGDKPEGAFSAYRRTLASFGQASTVDYLHQSGREALGLGMLPHTNAGVLERDEMARLKQVNVSLGLMLENVSPRLCEPGMPHHRAPDKRPERRIKMIAEAGELRIPFTTGILIGIGETRRERVESLLAIRALHRRHGHIQEVIVQNFRAVAGPEALTLTAETERVPMARAPEPDDDEIAHAIALARLILDDEVGVQAPPNLNPGATERLLSSGINDWGGISPVTPDYINPRHPWPHLDALAAEHARLGFTLRPRLPVYERYLAMDGWVDADLHAPCRAAMERMERKFVKPASHPVTPIVEVCP